MDSLCNKPKNLSGFYSNLFSKRINWNSSNIIIGSRYDDLENLDNATIIGNKAWITFSTNIPFAQ